MGSSIGKQPPGCAGTGTAGGDWLQHQFRSKVRPIAAKAKRLGGILFLTVLNAALGAETNPPPATTSSLPRAETITNGLGAFQIKRGFRIELAASEPMVTSPVAMAFDENGRLFVAEMVGRDARGASLGRVRMLENVNPEGVFQNSTIYSEGLTLPSAVACYAGGVFVAAGTEILYLKDTKGDGLADARQVVLRGFGGSNTLDPDFLVNNLNWGPDNRIHGASGGLGGEIIAQNVSGPPVSIQHSDFSFDPRTLQVIAETGTGESGLCFDGQGRKFVSSYTRPLLTPAYELRYALRNPYYPAPSSLINVADPGEPIYPYLPSPAKGVITSPRGATFSPRWLTHAGGCAVYRGRVFPTNYFGNVFVADPDAHVVHRLVLQEIGLNVMAQRAVDEPATEFLTSRDPSFRPIQVINGPDGALYLADIQEGSERGRIYRILPERFKRAPLPKLGKAKTLELVSTLAQGDGWHQDTAARLLYERRDPAAPALLRKTLTGSRLASARVAALRALAGAAALSEEDVIRALRDPDETVRQAAVLLAEQLFKNGDASAALLGQLSALTSDPALKVRYQLAFSLGELQRPDKASALAQILTRDLYQPLVQTAVLSSVANGAGNLFQILAGDARFRNDPVGFEFLRRLATATGVSGHQDAVRQIGNFLAQNGLSAAQSDELLYDLGEGLYRTRSSLGLVDTQGALQPFYSGALNLATDTSQPEASRTAATRLLGVSSLNSGTVGDWLLLACSPPSGPALQTAAMETLGRYNDPQVVDSFLQIWPALAPVARNRGISVLLRNKTHAARILDALQTRSLSAGDLSSAQRNFLRTYPVPGLRLRAQQLLGPVPIERAEQLSRYKPALSLAGAPERGREVFRQRCASCHGAAWNSLLPSRGPALFRARAYSKDQLLASIIEPNRTVRRDYLTQFVESNEGETLLGRVVDENARSLTLQETDGGLVVWPQLNIRGMQAQGWSLMPEGLEIGLTVQDMADLMEYVLKGRR